MLSGSGVTSEPTSEKEKFRRHVFVSVVDQSLNNYHFIFWHVTFLKRFSSVFLYFNVVRVRLGVTLLNVWDEIACK